MKIERLNDLYHLVSEIEEEASRIVKMPGLHSDAMVPLVDLQISCRKILDSVDIRKLLDTWQASEHKEDLHIIQHPVDMLNENLEKIWDKMRELEFSQKV
jgi:hypothetical protein